FSPSGRRSAPAVGRTSLLQARSDRAQGTSRDEGAFAKNTTPLAFPLPLHLCPPRRRPGRHLKSSPLSVIPALSPSSPGLSGGSTPHARRPRKMDSPHTRGMTRRESDQMFHGLTAANTGVSRTISPTYPRTPRPVVFSPHRAAVERLATNEGGGGTGW